LKAGIKRGRPEALYFFGKTPGDDLLCTGALRELALRGQKAVWMMSCHPELFDGNGDVAQVVPYDHFFVDYPILLGRQCRFLEYAKYDPQTDKSSHTGRHAIVELCARTGVTGEVTVRPYLAVSERERQGASWASGKIAIQSSGLAANLPMRNKEWFPERFQAVVNRLRGEFEFVQIGSARDPLLENTRDLRGKTSLRESAAILSQARLFVGLEGFPMHLARAVDCPAVIIFGGRTEPWLFGYGANINLYSAVPCAPCLQWNLCDFGRVCHEMITVDDVISGIRRQLERPRDLLPVDKAVIAAV